MRRGIGAAVALLAAVAAAAQTPLGTTFTYQGQLRDGGNAATGSYDFQFALFGVASGGSAIGSAVDRPGVAVANGLFIVSLDFGAAAFAGDARWLEIRVKPAGAPLYTVLGTRQPLSAAPYALAAASVVDGAIVDADLSATANISGAKLANASVTGAKIAGGPGSGVHADTLDSLNATQFLRSDQNGTLRGTLTVDDGADANTVLSETGIIRSGTDVVPFSITNGGTGAFDATQLLLEHSPLPNAPAYSFVNDPDTGLTHRVLDEVQLVAGGQVIARASAAGLTATPATTGAVAVRGDASAFAASDGVFGIASSGTSRGVVAQQTGSGPALVASSAAGDHFRASLSAAQADFNPVLRILGAGQVASDSTFAFAAPVSTTSVPPPFNAIGDPTGASDVGVLDANDLFVSGTLGTTVLRTHWGIFGDEGGSNAVLDDDGMFVKNGFRVRTAGSTFFLLDFVDDETVVIGEDSFIRVGIGRTPTANTLEVLGAASKAAAGGWLANSDLRLKTDVQELRDPLALIRSLRPVTFRYTPEFLERHPGVKDVRYHNFVAQEFQQVFPDSVQDDGEGFLQMDSHPANVYAIGAIQELDRIVAAKDARIAALEARLARLEARLERLR